jgi:hypothetical protein
MRCQFLIVKHVGLKRFTTKYPDSDGTLPERIFVNQFPIRTISGMKEHEDWAVHCTVILMLTGDDSKKTALTLGRDAKHGPVPMQRGDILIFRGIRHELPKCKRNRSRLTINFFF